MGLIALALALDLGCTACGAESSSVMELFTEQGADHRWQEGRTSLALPYLPFDEAQRAPPRDSGWLEGQLYLSAQRGDPEADVAKVLFFVWRNEPGDLERARSRLDALPQDASWWNEVALLHLANGDELDALEALEHALELEPELLPALFNRALIFDRLSLHGPAEEAWSHYVEVDPDDASGWRQEAGGHLERLRSPSPPPVLLEDERAWLEKELRSVASGPELAALLDEPRTGEVVSRLAAVGDRLFERELEVRQSFTERDWRESRRRGEALGAQAEATLAGAPSIDALEALCDAPEPMIALRALRLLAYDAIVRLSPSVAKERLDAVVERCDELGCVLESALALSDRGTLLLEAGDFRSSALAFREAFALLPEGFDARQAEILAKQGYLASALASPREAVRQLQAAAAIQSRLRKPMSLAVVLTNLGAQAGGSGLDAAALALYREAARLAALSGVTSTDLIARSGVSAILTRMGRTEEALAVQEEAIAVAREKGVSGALVRLLGASARTHLQAGQSADALARGRELQGLSGSLGIASLHGSVRAIIGNAYLALGDHASAIRSFQGAIAANHDLLSSIEDPIRRTLLEARDGDPRIRLARLRAEEGDVTAAWELVAGGALRGLDRDECTIVFVRDDERLLVWSATVEGTRFDVRPLPKSLIGSGDFNLRIGLDGGPFRGTPERAMSQAEFVGTAWDEGRCPARTRRLTIIENPVTLVGVANHGARLSRPDAAVVIASSASKPWPHRSLKGPGLAIHSPRPVVSDRILPSLPSAPKEARLVLGLWPDSEELAGTDATPQEVARRVSGFELLHFGVHGESRAQAGASSFLVLAGEHGHLQVVDVLDLSLAHRSPVVVLSACKGAGETLEKERDGAGLPWAFLQAGASSVIAYEDSLDDRVALDFSAAFYARVERGLEVSVAFEEALEALRERWSPEIVASFALYI